MELDKALESAIHATIANEVLAKLDTKDRDTLLQGAIAKTIGGYDFQYAVSKVVAERAATVAGEMAASDEWGDAITEAISLGFNDYLIQLRAAMPNVLKEMLHGKERKGYSESAAKILRTWPEAKAE